MSQPLFRFVGESEEAVVDLEQVAAVKILRSSSNRKQVSVFLKDVGVVEIYANDEWCTDFLVAWEHWLAGDEE